MRSTPWTFGLCAVLAAAAVGACARAEPDAEVALYLVDDDDLSYAEAATADLTSLSLAETPFIGPGDIVSYDWDTHSMTLTEECHSRLKELFRYGERKPMISHPFLRRLLRDRDG